MELPARIAGWRKARGLTYRQIADACGISPAAIYQWEGRGENSVTTTPHLKHLEVFVSLCGVTMERFYGDVPKAKKRARAA